MIQLKRLNGQEFCLNAELIEQVEMAGNTVITLTTGNNFIVRQTVDEVIQKIFDYRKKICHSKEEKQNLKLGVLH